MTCLSSRAHVLAILRLPLIPHVSVSACVVLHTGCVSVSISRDERTGMFVQVVVSEACVSLGICTSVCVLFVLNVMSCRMSLCGSVWSVCAGHVYGKECLDLGVYVWVC